MTRRSALDVRISYNVNVRSEPHDARIEDSARLNLRAVMVSMEVGKVRLDTGEVLEEMMVMLAVGKRIV